MTYDNSDIRRQDRLLDRSRAEEVLRTAEHGVLSMCDDGGIPYAIPINYVWDGAETIYIHCAPEGRKLRVLSTNPHVSLCVVGHTVPQPQLFTTEYESIIAVGTATIVTDEGERRRAMRLLLRKFAPQYEAEGIAAAERSYHRLAVISIKMEHMSGKSKRI